MVLETTVRTLFGLLSEQVELIVCDNSDERSDFIESIVANNLKYFYDPIQKTIGENFSEAIGYAHGKYCVFIGDDDLVSINTELLLTYLDNEYTFDALVYNKSRFFWPGVKSDEYVFQHFNSNFKNSVVCKKINTDEIRNFAAQKGYMSIFTLPTPYHNIVNLDLLKRIKRENGNLVLGISPDISMGFLVSLYTDSVLFVNRSLTLYGGSKESGAGLSAKRAHHMPICKVDFFKVELRDWHSKLPFYWSESITFPQSVYMVCKKMNREFVFDINYFYAYAYSKEPYLWRQFFPYLKFGNPIIFSYYYTLLTIKQIVWLILGKYYYSTSRFKSMDDLLKFENESCTSISST